MPGERQSLLDGGEQGELLSAAEIPDRYTAKGNSPEYTAERFFSERPTAYRECVALLAAGVGLLRIAERLQIHHRTAAAVRDREGSRIDIQKQNIKRNLRLAIELGCERMPEVIQNLPGGQLPISIAVLIDKHAQLESEPQPRQEINITGQVTHAALIAQLSAFPMGSRPGDAKTKGASGDGVIEMPAASVVPVASVDAMVTKPALGDSLSPSVKTLTSSTT